MGPAPKKPGAIDARGGQPRDAQASAGEKRRSSGTNSGEWLVNVSEDVVVPMTTTEIVDGLRAAKLSQRSLVWRIGMHDWTILNDVPQLRLAAGSVPSMPPPSSTRAIQQQPVHAQAESQRRRNTLPFGFPAVKDPASIRQPAGLAASTPLSAPRISSLPAAPAPSTRDDESGALAIYERPAASLTFSDSVRAEWQGSGRIVNQAAAPPSSASPGAPKLTPVPAVSARLQQNLRSNFPSSLVPTTAESTPPSGPRGPGAWGDLSVVLASDFRAAKASSRRVAIWAALGSALAASVFTVWLVRSPKAPPAATALQAPEHAAAPPMPAPAAAPTIAAPSSSASAAPVAAKSAPAPRPAAKPALAATPRSRPKPAAAAPVLAVPSPAAESDNPYAASEPATPPAAAPSPAPAASPNVEATPAPPPKAEPAPTDPSGL